MLLMRIVVLLFVLFLESIHAHAQETFECHVKDAPFVKVSEIIRQQTGCTLFFQSQAELDDIRITVNEKKITIDDFLKKYLGLLPITDYIRDGRTFVIKRKIS